MNQTITYLLRKVEAKYGQRPQTPGMFDMLALDIKKTCGQPISASTLKRVWGYVQSTHEPSLETLSLLARYVGSHDWNEFRQTCSESGFINRPVITADLIPMGQPLRGGAPRRRTLFSEALRRQQTLRRRYFPFRDYGRGLAAICP